MPKELDDYKATLDGMRKILATYTRAIDAWLIATKANEKGEVEYEAGDPEVLLVVNRMVHMTGISAHSILKLTEEIGLQSRDCYPIARSIVESVVNIIFILARGREASERADHHAQQKAYRDLNRKASAGGISTVTWSNVQLATEEKARLAELAAEFSTAKGHEKRVWTDESLYTRIDIAAERFPESVLLVTNAAFNIYRPSSEVIHGTYYSAMHFWGLTTIGRSRPATGDELRLVMAEHQFSVLMSVLFAFSDLLCCLADYVGLADLKNEISKEINKLKTLPLIAKAMRDSDEQTQKNVSERYEEYPGERAKAAGDCSNNGATAGRSDNPQPFRPTFGAAITRKKRQ